MATKILFSVIIVYMDKFGTKQLVTCTCRTYKQAQKLIAKISQQENVIEKSVTEYTAYYN